MTITSSGPLSRHITEYLTDARVTHYKCKTLQNPDFFFDGRVYGAVDVAHKLDTSTEKAGGLWLRSKAIVSVGTKKADDAYKLFGLRPDENQGGSESVEWSVESIEINGKVQTINLRDRLEVSPITTKFGDNLYVQRARQRCRIMVPGDSATESFKIALRLHLKGCTVEYRKALDEYWIYRGGKFFCRFGKPYLVDMDMNPIQGDFVRHSLTEISKGEYRYTKEPTAAFALADLPASYLIDADTVYSTTEDGTVYRLSTDTTWDDCHNAAVGLYVNKTASSIITASASLFNNPDFRNYRSFFTYPLNSISETVSACSENWYGATLAETTTCVQKGTQADSLTVNDYVSFSGVYYGTTTWSTSGYNTISYNAGGISDVKAALGGNFKTCIREYTHDYLDASPGTSKYRNGCFFSDDTSGTKDPYLYITTSGGATKKIPYHLLFRRVI